MPNLLPSFVGKGRWAYFTGAILGGGSAPRGTPPEVYLHLPPAGVAPPPPLHPSKSTKRARKQFPQLALGSGSQSRFLAQLPRHSLGSGGIGHSRGQPGLPLPVPSAWGISTLPPSQVYNCYFNHLLNSWERLMVSMIRFRGPETSRGSTLTTEIMERMSSLQSHQASVP